MAVYDDRGNLLGWVWQVGNVWVACKASPAPFGSPFNQGTCVGEYQTREEAIEIVKK